MKNCDNLQLKITQKISTLSQGIDDKINNAAVQSKTVSELGTAICSHLQKIVEVASTPTSDPSSTLSTVVSAIQSLSSAIRTEESRIRGNHDSLVIRKQVIQEISIAVAEEFAAQELQRQAGEKVEPQQLESDQPIPPAQDVPEVTGGSSPASSIYINEETSCDPEPKAEIPAHVSRFFNG